MVLMVFLQLVQPAEDLLKIKIFGFDLQMRESVYKGMLFPLADAVIRFVLEDGVDNILTKTLYSPVLAHRAVLRWLGVD